MNKKTVVILLMALLLVTLLFVASLALSGRKPGAGSKIDLQAPSMSRIGSWISRPVKASYLTLVSDNPEDCILENNLLTIQAGATCVYALPSDKLWTRKLRMVQPTPESGGEQITITLRQPDAYDVEQTLTPDKTDDPLDVYGREDQAAATITIHAGGDSGAYLIGIVEK